MPALNIKKQSVQQLLFNHDPIGLKEIKTSLPVSFPGYATYGNKMLDSANRGGAALVVKNCSDKSILNLYINIVD